MARLLDAWDAAKAAPEPLEVARRSAGDALLAGEEFRGARDEVVEGLALGDPSQRDFGRIVGGAGAGLFTAGTFLFPGGRTGALAVGVGRGAAGRGTKGAALRAAAGLGDEAAEGLVSGPTGPGVFARSGESAGEFTSRRGEVFSLRENVSVDDFERSLAQVRPMRVTPEGQPFRSVEETVYQYPTEKYRDMKLFVSDDGLSGFAIKPDGDLVSVFSAPGLGRAEALLDVAIARGARKLDAFDEGGFLPGLYASKGFVEVRREPWNPAYKPEVWRGGEPDVVFMELPESAPWLRSGRARYTEELPTEEVARFAEFERTGPRVEKLARDIVNDAGISEPLILDVGMNGRAVLTEGNHRLAAALRLGLERVPVTTVTARSVAGGAEAAVRDVGAGKLLKPSEVLQSVGDAPSTSSLLPPPLPGVRGAVEKANIPEMRRAIVEFQETARINAVNDPRLVDEFAERMVSDIDVEAMARLWAAEGLRRGGLQGRIPANVRTQGGEIIGGVPQSPLSEAGLIPSRFLNPGDEPFVYAARWARTGKKEDLLDFSRSIQRLRLNQTFGFDDTSRGGAPWYLERSARARDVSSSVLDDSGRIAYDPVFVAAVMAGFSAGAPPILEPVRALFAMPFVRATQKGLVFDIDAFAAAYPSLAPIKNGKPLSGYNTWGAEVAAAVGNDLDITRRNIISLSDKTFPYAVATIDATNPFALVIDRNAVYQAAGHNAFGEFTSASGKIIQITNPFNQGNATQQMLGFHAMTHGASRGVDGLPMGGQERGWFGTRIFLQGEIGESFWLPPGVARERKQMLSTEPLMREVFDPTQAQTWDEITMVAFDGMGSAFGPENVRRVRQISADTREKFIEKVRRGELDDWEMLNGQPVVKRDKWERVLPPRRRYMPKTLQSLEDSGLTAAELAASGARINEAAMLSNARAIIEQARGPFADWIRTQYSANPQRTFALLAMLIPAAAIAGSGNNRSTLSDWVADA